MANDFAVHLGGGVYLNSSGTIVFGPHDRRADLPASR